MPQIDGRLRHLPDPDVTENFNRVLKVAGKGVAEISLTVDASGKITGGTAVLLDGSEVPVTVETAEST